MAARKPAAKKSAKKKAATKTTQQQNGRTAEFDQRVLRVLGRSGAEKAVSDVALALEVDNSFVRRSVKRLAAAKSVALRKEGVSIFAKRV